MANIEQNRKLMVEQISKLKSQLNEAADIDSKYKQLQSLKKDIESQVKKLYDKFNLEVKEYNDMIKNHLDGDYKKLTSYLSKKYKGADVTESNGIVTVSYKSKHKKNKYDVYHVKNDKFYITKDSSDVYVNLTPIKKDIESKTKLNVNVTEAETGFDAADFDFANYVYLLSINVSFTKAYQKKILNAKPAPYSNTIYQK